MTRLFVRYPRVTVAVSVPEAVAPAFARNFTHALLSSPPPSVLHAYDAVEADGRWVLVRDGERGPTYPTSADLMFALEEELENALIARLGGWIGLHAGAVAMGEQAIVTVGLSDTGKTTTTFQLLELGLDLVAEEVAPIDPDTRCVQPFPQVLSLSRQYGEQFVARHPIAAGTLTYHDASLARYTPARVRTHPVPVSALLFPRFHPSLVPRLEAVTPADVLTEIFRYCFPPQTGEERLYDDVIRLLEACRLWRLHTCDVESSRTQLREVIAELS